MMEAIQGWALCACGLALGVASLNAAAAVSEQQAQRLGQELTPIGAQRAGEEGPHGVEIPAWTDGWVEPDDEKRTRVPDDPFADEEPLFVITAENAGDYADVLTAGQQAMLSQYPQSYRMRVYPTHRTATVPQWVQQATVENAQRVELKAGGSGFTGTAHGFPFPIPANGQEVMWNHIARFRTTGYRGFVNSAITTANGDYVIERQYLEIVFRFNNPDVAYTELDNRMGFLMVKTVAPANKAGEAALLHLPLDRAQDDTLVWTYNLGTRKVRRIGEVGYDNPARDGLMTHDQFDMFNGPLDRYGFKLVGKRIVAVPYNNYRLASEDVEYEDILHKGHVNPDLVRYELHRMWVVEADKRPDTAHIYKKRVFYIDEDSWLILAQDIYDERDEFWRASEAFALHYPQVPLTSSQLQAHYDLQSRRYVMSNLRNDEPDAIEYDFVKPDSYFTTSALRRFAEQRQR